MSKVGRPATGSLVWTKTGWAARVTTTVDGERVRMQRQLGTTNKLAAQRKLERLLASEAPAQVESVPAETFQQASERVNARRVTDGVRCASDELARLRLYAFPALSNTPVAAVTSADVNAALDFCKSQGKSRQTVAHLRQAIRIVFDALRREGEIATNPVDDAAMPRFRAEVRKERAVLTDEELGVYLAYSHPVEHWRMPILERQVMACIARCFGGLRTGDLHALDWSAFDVAQGGFEWGWAPRRKTKRPQLLEVPEMLRPILCDWWERAGRPASGLVFPARRGKRAGEVKLKVSHADAFRRDLRRAFGVETWNAKTGRFETVRELTRRERELFEETGHTLPADFHSWRRAFTQALADADVNAQQATALAGHASLSAHARYLASSGKLRKVPEAALPGVLALSAPNSRTPSAVSSVISARRTGLEPAASGVTGRPGCFTEASQSISDAWSCDLQSRASDENRGQRRNSLPKVPSPLFDAQLADATLSFALRGLASRCALNLLGAQSRPSEQVPAGGVS